MSSPAAKWPSPPAGGSPDASQWLSFRSGDKESLGRIYCRYESGMYRYGMSLCGDSDLVRDAMQDLFSRLWDSRERISNAGCIQMYLYRSLRRLILQQVIRYRKRFTSFSDGLVADSADKPAEENVIEKESCASQCIHLRKAVRLLSKHQREVITLRFFNGLNYNQIAEIMGMQVDSVYNLVSKALESLRIHLSVESIPETGNLAKTA